MIKKKALHHLFLIILIVLSSPIFGLIVESTYFLNDIGFSPSELSNTNSVMFDEPILSSIDPILPNNPSIIDNSEDEIFSSTFDSSLNSNHIAPAEKFPPAPIQNIGRILALHIEKI